MILYKYAHTHGLDILKSLEIKASEPDEFNDPFEFMPVIPKTTPASTVEKTLKNVEMQKYMYGLAKEAGFLGNFRAFRASLRQHSDQLVAVSASNPELPKKIRDEIMGQPLAKIAVFCTSALPDSTLMWSHYADCHRGVVLGIDMKQASQQWADDLLEVQYSGTRVDMNLKWLPGSDEHRKFAEEIVKVKSLAWRCEEEYRLLFKIDTLRRKQLKNGSMAYFSPIPPAAIREVILGCRSAAKTEQDV